MKIHHFQSVLIGEGNHLRGSGTLGYTCSWLARKGNIDDDDFL